MSTRRIVALAALGLSLLCGVAFAASALLRSEAEARTVVREPIRKLVVRAEGGDVTLRAGVSPFLIVEQQVTWLLSRPEVRQTRRGGELEVDATCPATEVALRCSLELDVLVPSTVQEVVFEGDAADVELRGLHGVVRASTGSGDLHTDRLDTVVFEVRTESGDLHLDLVGAPTRVVADTDSGDVDVVLPFGTYRVDVDSGDSDRVTGLLRDDLAPQRIDATSGSGRVTVRAR
ncbi:DUF4097 family beta strand repeat-containing protein [Conexibacter sp. SYSU D00693]|uniref:DUF4097 family beta strand repeat-containing protein n=1 Tax=Conexibacter sp. SYSU D00693 TaxID=2812560 RepID=UPI00196A4AC8|nr:DUF4097 family beta strand repeat-containing protein [Conexibacter sp. SYSU D00693]